jgi:chitodextrinase
MWFCAGEQRIERSFIAEWPIYRQIWNKDIDYQKGDTVTFDGSQWTAIQTSKGSRPGQFNSAWKLSVKRGRNGKSFNDN